MYQPPVSIDKDKQCQDCKQYENVGCWISCCLANQGFGLWNVVLAAGTCEDWEREKVEMMGNLRV